MEIKDIMNNSLKAYEKINVLGEDIETEKITIEDIQEKPIETISGIIDLDERKEFSKLVAFKVPKSDLNEPEKLASSIEFFEIEDLSKYVTADFPNR